MIDFLKEYSIYYKKYKLQILLAFIGMILVSVATAGVAYLIKPVLDKIFIQKDSTSLYLLPLGIIVVYFIKGVGAVLQQYYISYIGEDIVRKIRNKLLEHIVNFDIDYFKNTHSGELVSKIINDISKIQNAVSLYLAEIFRDIIMAIFLLIVVIYQNPKLALFSLVILPVMIIPIDFLSKKIKKLSTTSQELTANLNKNLSEIFKNIETIKAFNAQKYETERFKKSNLSFFNINIKTIRTKAMLIPILEFLSSIIAAIVIIFGGKEVIDGTMSVGAFFSFLTALFMLTDPIRRVSINYSNLQEAIAANDRLKELFKINPTINTGKLQIDTVNDIEFKDVYLKYGNKTALKGINYKVLKPKKVALIGDSGGGKSSFIYLIERFYDTTNGDILLNGKSIKNYSINSLRDKISYISQNIHIFNDTIANNIAYGTKVDKDRLLKAIEDANLNEFINGLPKGIDTILQENGANLSGGQKQRVAIARALYREPDILILDEATSALDNINEKEILNTISKINNKIIFIIAHKLNVLDYVDEVLLFKDGEIACNGSKDELIKSCKEFNKIYQ